MRLVSVLMVDEFDWLLIEVFRLQWRRACGQQRRLFWDVARSGGTGSLARIFLAEGPLPCLPMAAKQRTFVPLGLMLVGRLWREGRQRSFLCGSGLFWKCIRSIMR